MERKRIIVVGNNFAGHVAAMELKKLLGYDHEVIVISKTANFVFTPSLVLFPFDLRKEDELLFEITHDFYDKCIKFIEAEVICFDPEKKIVKILDEEIHYHYLLIATGPKVDFESVPGLGPDKYTLSVCDIVHAQKTRRAWNEFLKNPGPVVAGIVQGSGCFGVAYEFILNVYDQLKQRNLLDKAPLTFITAEPFLGHFGIGESDNLKVMVEKLFDNFNIKWKVNAALKEVLHDKIILQTGEEIPSKFTMLMPRFVGVDAVRNTKGLGNEEGFIETNEECRHKKYPEIYAAGVAVQVASPGEVSVLYGIHKTGFPLEQMAKIAAWNIYADIYRKQKKTLSFEYIQACSIIDTEKKRNSIIENHINPLEKDPLNNSK